MIVNAGVGSMYFLEGFEEALAECEISIGLRGVILGDEEFDVLTFRALGELFGPRTIRIA